VAVLVKSWPNAMPAQRCAPCIRCACLRCPAGTEKRSMHLVVRDCYHRFTVDETPSWQSELAPARQAPRNGNKHYPILANGAARIALLVSPVLHDTAKGNLPTSRRCMPGDAERCLERLDLEPSERGTCSF